MKTKLHPGLIINQSVPTTAKNVKEMIDIGFDLINDLIMQSDYRISLNGKVKTQRRILKEDYSEAIIKASGACRKRIIKASLRLQKKQTIVSMNRFLNGIAKWIDPETILVYSIRKSLKEEEIIAARNNYVSLRNQTIKAYNDYKEVKGDYYK